MSEVAGEVPNHVGIILDGNRRWATDRGLPVRKGHEAGYRNIREVSRRAMDEGVNILSIFGFSVENWNRTEEEVGFLMGMFKRVLKHDIKSVHEEGARFRFCGSEEGLDPGLLDALRQAEELTEGNERGQLVLCLNYSGQQEVVDAIKSIIGAGIKPEDVDAQTVAEHSYIPDLPDLDLMIRTSGEQRTSDFMTMRAGQAELMFSDRLWPDFTPDDFSACLEDYAQRDRRLGR